MGVQFALLYQRGLVHLLFNELTLRWRFLEKALLTLL
jgi:hypothetical protein